MQVQVAGALFLVCICHSFGVHASPQPNAQFRGIRSAIQQMSDGSSLRILLVHGVGCHPAGWSQTLQKGIAARLGFTKVNYAATDPSNLKLARQVLYFSTQNTIRPPLLRAQESIPPSANDICGPLSNYTKFDDGAKGELPTLIIDNYISGNRTLSFFEVTWSPLVLALKSKNLGYDVSKKETRQRAKWNGWMKDQLVDSLFSDAIFYLGVGRQQILNIVAFSVCRLWQDSPTLDASGQAVCDARNEGYRAGIHNNRYVFVSESLGSQIVFDALRHDSLLKAVDDGLQETDSIFMLSNQLPLLELGQKLPDAIQPAVRPELLGAQFNRWLAGIHADPLAPVMNIEVTSALSALQRDIEEYKRIYAIRLYQSEFQTALDTAKGDVANATETNNRAVQALVTLQGKESKRIDELNHNKTDYLAADKAYKTADATLKRLDSNEVSYQANADQAAQLYFDTKNKILKEGKVPGTSALDAAYANYAAAITSALTAASDLLSKCIIIKGYYIDGDNPQAQETLTGRQTTCNVSIQKLKQHLALANFVSKRISLSDQTAKNAQDSVSTKITNTQQDLTRFDNTKPSTAISYNFSLEAFRKDAANEASAFDIALQAITASEVLLSHAITNGAAVADTGDIQASVSAALLKDSSLTFLESQSSSSRDAAEKAKKTAENARQRYNLVLLASKVDDLKREQLRLAAEGIELATKIAEAMLLQDRTGKRLAELKKAELTITEQYESPRDDGIAGFYALLQQGEGPLKEAQAIEVANHADMETAPAVRNLLIEIASKLKMQASSIRRPQFVALTDPNDLLGFTISEAFGARYPGAGFLNHSVQNEHTILNLYADPDKAHSGYMVRSTVLSLMVEGHD